MGAETIHGHTWREKGIPKASPEYSSWRSMINRCERQADRCFPLYGGRGIKVCSRWRSSFADFLHDMGCKPSPNHTLDRWPNKDGDYEPGNVRWATPKQQARNRRNSRLITFRGESHCVTEWAEIANISTALLIWRLNTGWPIDQALQKRPR